MEHSLVMVRDSVRCAFCRVVPPLGVYVRCTPLSVLMRGGGVVAVPARLFGLFLVTVTGFVFAFVCDACLVCGPARSVWRGAVGWSFLLLVGSVTVTGPCVGGSSFTAA